MLHVKKRREEGRVQSSTRSEGGSKGRKAGR